MTKIVEVNRWLDPSEWVRDGRGRDWQFQLRTAKIVRALCDAAQQAEDVELLVCSRAQRGQESVSIYTSKRPAELALEGPWQYFVRLRSTTPAIPAPSPLTGVGWPALFAINGLVLLHHPDPGRRTDPPRSSIGIIHRVVNVRSGEVHEHREYDKFFKTLKRFLGEAGALPIR